MSRFARGFGAYLSATPYGASCRYYVSGSAYDECLESGMVIAVTGYVWQEGVGGVLRRDTVLVTDDGAEVLTHSPCWQGDQTR